MWLLLTFIFVLGLKKKRKRFVKVTAQPSFFPPCVEKQERHFCSHMNPNRGCWAVQINGANVTFELNFYFFYLYTYYTRKAQILLLIHIFVKWHDTENPVMYPSLCVCVCERELFRVRLIWSILLACTSQTALRRSLVSAFIYHRWAQNPWSVTEQSLFELIS